MDFCINLSFRPEIVFYSTIAQVMKEMHTLWLVKDWVISSHNYPMRGDYNTKALILKMATAQFVDVWEEETKKKNERKCSSSNNHLSIIF